MIRRGGPADVPFMRAMLMHAYHWRVAGLDAEVPLERYVGRWGRPGDVAVVAAEGPNRIGAAWARRFAEDGAAYGFVDEQTPELTIAVVPSRRRHGVGQELLDALLARLAGEGVARVSLSVQQGSAAVGFYERNGFVPVAEAHGAVTMVREITP